MRAAVQSIRNRAGLARVVVAAVARLASYRASECAAAPSVDRALGSFQRWCRRSWPRLRLVVQVDGRPSATPCVYLANHRSYLDIVVLGGVLGAAFLSRADVAAWPVIGAAASAIGTVFVDRDDPYSAARAARALARRLRSHSIVVFPEGTTGGASLPQPFATGIFRLLARRLAPIVPVTIRYGDSRAYWIDDRSPAEHLLACMAAPDCIAVTVHVGAPLEPSAESGTDALAAAAYHAVCAPIDTWGEFVVAPRQNPA